MTQIRLPAETDDGRRLTVTLTMSEPCECEGMTLIHPGWAAFFDKFSPTGLPAQEVLATYSEHYWRERNEEPPPRTVVCAECRGTGEVPTQVARDLANAIAPLIVLALL
jgi:hypothetical protein